MADVIRAFRSAEFLSEGATLHGRLYMPKELTPPFPAVIMAHGFTATITMVADRYAEAFCSAGFAVLLYDHRNFGISEGEPRHHINQWVQARGYRDAMTFLEGLPEIDASRLAIWGDSMSGAAAMVVAACDKRVRAVVVQVPACGRTLPAPDLDQSRFQAIEETLLHGDINLSPKLDGPMPVVSFDFARHPSALEPITAYRWFIEYGGRFGTNWVNDVTRVQPMVPEAFNAVICASHINAPLLMVVSPEDEMPGSNPQVARAAYEVAPGPKEWREIDGGHFGLLYYPSDAFAHASAVQIAFLQKHL